MTGPELDELTQRARDMIGGAVPRFDILDPPGLLTAQVHDWRRLAKALLAAVVQLRGGLAWQRVEPGECSCHVPAQVHTRWELPGETAPDGMLRTAGHLVTDELIRTYGRQHVEQMLARAGAPPLPDQAWEILT